MAAAGASARASRLILAALALLFSAPPLAARGAESFSEVILRGFEQLEGGRHGEALQSFSTAVELEPDSGPALRGLATASAALATARIRAGKLREARALLEQAVKAQPANADYRLLLAGVIFRGADTRAARAEIDRVLERAPASAAARELSGDIYAREGLLNLAVGEWEAAAASGGSHSLDAKIARGRREMTAEEGMGRESSRHFVILYEREVPPELVQHLFGVLDRAFDIVHEQLGDYPRDPITVILYSRAAFSGVTVAPEWSGGLYDGKIRLPVGGLTTGGEVANLLFNAIHEMTHAFLHRMAPFGLPLWFNEGLATTFGGWDPQTIRARFAEHPPEGLASLEDLDKALLGGGGSVKDAYMAARLAVQEMVDMRGDGAIRRVISGVGEGGSFAEVFAEEMRAGLAEFEERWREGLR